MNEELFEFDLRVLNAGGSDIILGMDWVNTIVAVVLHTRPHNISFLKEGKFITLLGKEE